MFDCIKNKVACVALGHIKDNVVNPNLEGIGRVKEISYKDRKLFLTLLLEGLEDRPIEVVCEDVEIANDGSSIKINKASSNLACVHNALNQFAIREFEVPEGSARLGLKMAKKLLDL